MLVLAVATCASMTAQTVFVHANVFNGTRLLRNQTLVTEGGIITGLGGKLAHPPNAQIIDCKGKTLLPALIDAVAEARNAGWVQIDYDDGFAWGDRHPPVSFEALHDEVEAAHKERKRVLISVGSLRESTEALKAEADGLLRIFAGAQSDPAFVKLAARRKVFIIPMVAALEGAVLKGGKPRREGSLETLRQLHKAHVPMLAGGALAEELELLVRDVGMTPIQALQSATSLPARLFGLKDRGTIAVGKRAELLLVNGDPTVSITVLAQPVKQAGSRAF